MNPTSGACVPRCHLEASLSRQPSTKEARRSHAAEPGTMASGWCPRSAGPLAQRRTRSTLSRRRGTERERESERDRESEGSACVEATMAKASLQKQSQPLCVPRCLQGPHVLCHQLHVYDNRCMDPLNLAIQAKCP